MEDFVYYNKLYDFYQDLLTDKQKEYFEYYYFENLSLGEIAINLKVSRNAVHKQLQIVKERLDFYEEKLKMNEKYEKLSELCNKISDEKLKEEIKRVF